nr:retrovirus-related Pol polyprotein from transposon TNT 1-94 [Tanacetum cinerariifolium]
MSNQNRFNDSNWKKNTLAKYMILSGADNRPPMLDKNLYDSWKSIMELYLQNKEHERMILESVKHDPLNWHTIEENVVTRTKKYAELSATEKIQADCDLKETNIILQGLPSDIYSLVNHHRVVKDLWEKIQLLMLVPVSKQGDDPIDAINKMMSFLSTVFIPRFPSTNNQLRNSFNPRQQATIHDGRVTVQPGGHMARQCLKPKRKRYAIWFRDKVLLVEANGNGKALNKEELEFLADHGVAEGPVTKTVNTHNAAYQADDLDAYDSDCDDFSTANEVLMANLSSYGSDVLSEDTNSHAQQDAKILSVFEQLSNQVTNCNKVNKDNLTANESLYAELERYKERIRPMLYDGSVISKETNVISIADSEETLMHEEESWSKMLLKQSDLMVLEKKVNIKPINYAELNRLIRDFDIVNILVNSLMDINTFVNVNSSVIMNDSMNYVEMCNKCLELKAELIKQQNMVEKYEYNRVSKSFSKLKEHCISLELAMQVNKEIFQNTFVNKNDPSFDQLFELNNLKAKIQSKDTTNNVKKDIDEIETINIELEHRVTKLIAENEHLKQTYKQLYDSIKRSRVQAKEHIESLVNQLNQKKRHDYAAQASNATTIAPGMYKLDLVTLAPKEKNNRETHIYYLKHTIEQDAILREIVEQAKSLNPLDSASYST